MTLFVIFHFLLRGVLPRAFLDILDAIGGWIVWFVVVGPVLVIVGGWYFGDTIRKKREFEELIDVHSKARFVRNQARLEELSWYLPSEYHRRIRERKRHWKIRE